MVADSIRVVFMEYEKRSKLNLDLNTRSIYRRSALYADTKGIDITQMILRHIKYNIVLCKIDQGCFEKIFLVIRTY